MDDNKLAELNRHIKSLDGQVAVAQGKIDKCLDEKEKYLDEIDKLTGKKVKVKK